MVGARHHGSFLRSISSFRARSLAKGELGSGWRSRGARSGCAKCCGRPPSPRPPSPRWSRRSSLPRRSSPRRGSNRPLPPPLRCGPRLSFGPGRPPKGAAPALARAALAGSAPDRSDPGAAPAPGARSGPGRRLRCRSFGLNWPGRAARPSGLCPSVEACPSSPAAAMAGVREPGRCRLRSGRRLAW